MCSPYPTYTFVSINLLQMTNHQHLLFVVLITMIFNISFNQNSYGKDNDLSNDEASENEEPRLKLGGYGEVVLSRMFYSSNYKRYTDASEYADDKGYGKFDIPHVVFFVSYDFGKGWSMQSEIEFEHGGLEAAVEIEEEETGEYESEIESGGEVALEQFWIQKSFGKKLNIRIGHIVVPVGLTNQHHMPTEFFTAYRPEGESTIIPCTWHETGVSFWGKLPNWRYEIQMIAGLDADRFGAQNWINSSSGSPYEFKMATNYAGVVRIDNYSLNNLRWAVSGYLGNSANNTLSPSKYEDLKGTVGIAAFDFNYSTNKIVIRGNFDFGHLTDSEAITAANMNSREDSPSPKTSIASDAICTGIEAGYDMFSFFHGIEEENKLYLFARYDYYDSMFKTEGSIVDNECWGRQLLVGGVNYKPMDELVLKAEFSHRILKSQYNNENTVSFSIAYAGFYKK